VTTPRLGGSLLSPPASPARPNPLLALLAVLLVLLCVLAGPPARASENKEAKPYALIFGTVWGPDDRPLYGVKVRIRRADQKKAHWELISDHRGEFAQRVPAGEADYVVWPDLKGYKSPLHSKLQVGPEVKVHIERDERVDIGLHLK
jgi:hypothetical protein